MEDLVIVSETELLDSVTSIILSKEASPSEIVWSEGRSSKKSTKINQYFGNLFSLFYEKQAVLQLM